MAEVIMKNKLYKLVRVSSSEISSIATTLRDKYLSTSETGVRDTLYVVKKKMNLSIWVIDKIITRKKYDDAISRILKLNRLESDKAFEKRVISEFRTEYIVVS